MRPPHLLLVHSNWRNIQENLKGVLSARSINKIDKELKEQAKSLVHFGIYHLRFAESIPNSDWRQVMSRLYYAAYNISKAVRLMENYQYSIDSSDHQKVDQLPDKFPNKSRYATRLKDLRTDRNLSDYDHSASEAELLVTLSEAKTIVNDFLSDAIKYFKKHKGISI